MGGDDVGNEDESAVQMQDWVIFNGVLIRAEDRKVIEEGLHILSPEHTAGCHYPLIHGAKSGNHRHIDP